MTKETTDPMPEPGIPKAIQSLLDQIFQEGEDFLAFEAVAGEPEGIRYSRHVVSCLVPLQAIQNLPVGDHFGFEIEASGPFPGGLEEEPYIPYFKIWTNENLNAVAEPLILSWKNGDARTVVPSPSFLMTYGLVSSIHRTTGEVHWGRPDLPKFSIVVSVPSGTWDFPVETRSSVCMNMDYAQDYSSIRQQAIVRHFLIERWVSGDGELEAMMEAKRHYEYQIGCCDVRIVRLSNQDQQEFFIELRGYDIPFRPSGFPISNEDNDEEVLSWPASEGEIEIAGFGWRATQGVDDWAFVKDEILCFYEGREGFTISPESGSVGFRGEWIIQFCTRVGRDLIRVELRKLYEGVPVDEIRRWHSLVSPPPKGDIVELMGKPNIGRRAKELTDNFFGLTNGLDGINLKLGQPADTSVSIFDLAYLRSHGYWKEKKLELLSRWCPRTANLENFLERAKRIYAVVGESLSAGSLRKILLRVGMPRKVMSTWGTLRLLAEAVTLAHISTRDGLSIEQEGQILIQRRKEEDFRLPELKLLFALNEIRQFDAHPGAADKVKINDFLEQIGIDPASVAQGWGLAVDAMYDAVTGRLENLTRSLQD